METSHGMSSHLVWDLTYVRLTNIPIRCVCLLLLFPLSLSELYNDEEQSKHYTLSVLRTLHYCDIVLRVVALQISYCMCAHARTRTQGVLVHRWFCVYIFLLDAV